MLRLAMRGFDAALAMTVGAFYFWCLPNLDYIYGIDYPLLIIAGALLLPAVGEMLGLYQAWRGRSIFSMFGTYFASWAATILLISAFLVVTQSGYIYSRLWMALSSLECPGHRPVGAWRALWLSAQTSRQRPKPQVGAVHRPPGECRAGSSNDWPACPMSVIASTAS